MMKPIAILSALLAVSQVSWAVEYPALPTIISFGGTGPAFVKSGNREKEAQVGMTVPYGALIRTGPSNTLTVSYPDGSLLSVDADTQVRVQDRATGVQKNDLDTGQVRGSILKAREGAAQKRPKFVIRTKSAVMGVRGTEFVMAVDHTGLNTQVHTLEGVVDVAADEGSLFSGNATPVESGKFVEAGEKGVSAAQPFNKEEFLQQLKPSVPGGPSGVVFTADGGSVLKSAAMDKAEEERQQRREILEQNQRGQEPEKSAQEQAKTAAPAEEKKADAKENNTPSRKIQPVSFQAGAFFTHIDGQLIRAANVSWNPTIPVPFLQIFSVRGHLGFVFAQDGSLNKRLWVRELGVFGTMTLLDKVFGEVGYGHQSWARQTRLDGSPLDSDIFSVNVGFIASGGAINRVYVGRTEMLGEVQFPLERIVEYRAGIGLGF